MMAQWRQCKGQAKGALLLFRLGDFYEAFTEDAELLSRDLEVVLTQRQGVPMAGIPAGSLESALDRLVAKGHRVAIAEQVPIKNEARVVPSKTLMGRQVVRVVSAGTHVASSLISDKVNRFFACSAQVGELYGLALIDLTTSEFHLAELEGPEALVSALCRAQPAEWLVSEGFIQRHAGLVEEVGRRTGCVMARWHEAGFTHEAACAALRERFQLDKLRGMVAAINAAGALLSYLRQERALCLDSVCNLNVEPSKGFMSMDSTTQRHLDLLQLLELLDTSCTAMGGRLLRRWLQQPLLDLEAIGARHDAIEALLSQPERALQMRRLLEPIRDLERLVSRMAHRVSAPIELLHLRGSLEQLEPLAQATLPSPLLTHAAEKLHGFEPLIAALRAALVDAPEEWGVLRPGYNSELDRLRVLQREGRGWLVSYQTTLREQLGLRTLKVGYNRVTGYYIEVSRRESEQLPSHFVRRQTLATTERFLSPELSDFEGQLLSAESKLTALEAQLIEELRLQVQGHAAAIQAAAQGVAHIDSILALARAARRYGYVRPTVDGGPLLSITDGRHPVVERMLREAFVPNDALLDATKRMALITGPNMGGKSTYMRQVALICILAQMGSFVPARSAQIGLVDQILTRIGASDDLAAGRSTFMVEMAETAAILRQATSRSLVILDEIGRGTSTYDGIAIAWAVAEHLLSPSGPKTLFATHYLELTQLEQLFPTVTNWAVQVAEQNGTIAFLHRVIPGRGDRSYGIHVARLANLPDTVITRAQQLLERLEKKRQAKATTPQEQLSLFS